MWAMTYIPRDRDRERITVTTLLRVQEIALLETHYDTCPMRDRESEEKSPNWSSIQCRACRKALQKQEMLEKRRI
jgi:hypothetical protein